MIERGNAKAPGRPKLDLTLGLPNSGEISDRYGVAWPGLITEIVR